MAKLLEKTSEDNLLFGFARLSGEEYIEPVLSAKLPKFKTTENGIKFSVEVQNFGQVDSKSAKVKVFCVFNGVEK